jgi:hypothetical protein
MAPISDASDAMTIGEHLVISGSACAPARQAAMELMVQDNSVVSIVQRAGPGPPGFVPRGHAAIVEAANTVLRPQ